VGLFGIPVRVAFSHNCAVRGERLLQNIVIGMSKNCPSEERFACEVPRLTASELITGPKVEFALFEILIPRRGIILAAMVELIERILELNSTLWKALELVMTFEKFRPTDMLILWDSPGLMRYEPESNSPICESARETLPSSSRLRG